MESKQIHIYVCIVLFCMVISVSSIVVKIATILPADNSRIFSIDRVTPAIQMAIDELRNNYTLVENLTFSVEYANSQCSIAEGINQAIDFYINKKVDAFFGPVCDYAVAPVARQTRFWNIPLISGGAMARDFAIYRKSQYPKLTRVGPVNFNSLSDFFVKLFRHSGWKSLKILYNREGHANVFEDFCHLCVEAIHYDIIEKARDIKQDYFRLDEKPDLRKILLNEVGLAFGVVVLCASADSVRDIMIKAHELNFDNGEYVFLNIDLFSSKNESEQPWRRDDDTPERNEKARKAYEALMTVTLRKPTSPEYKHFSEEVKNRAESKDRNFTYGEEEVNSFVGAFHDAVILYAIALNETLTRNRSITNGTEITKLMWNRTFDGITGTVSIDDNGDRNADYSLLDMEPKSGKFQVVANYYGNNKEYKPEKDKKIYWAGGRNSPPPDTPTCGFDGSKCPPSEPFPEYGIVIIVLGSLLVIVLVTAFFIYRHKLTNNFHWISNN